MMSCTLTNRRDVLPLLQCTSSDTEDLVFIKCVAYYHAWSVSGGGGRARGGGGGGSGGVLNNASFKHDELRINK